MSVGHQELLFLLIRSNIRQASLHRACKNCCQQLPHLNSLSYMTYPSIYGLNWQLVARVPKEEPYLLKGFYRTSKEDRTLIVSFKRMSSIGYYTALKWRASHPTDVEQKAPFFPKALPVQQTQRTLWYCRGPLQPNGRGSPTPSAGILPSPSDLADHHTQKLGKFQNASWNWDLREHGQSWLHSLIGPLPSAGVI